MAERGRIGRLIARGSSANGSVATHATQLGPGSGTGAMSHPVVYLLSPANCGGKRASALLEHRVRSPLAAELRSGAGAGLGELFTYMSGLYFRGKLAYAATFAPAGRSGVLVIVPGRGLVAPDVRLTRGELQGIAHIPVDERDRRFREPLMRDARALCAALGARTRVVLLGSVATGKYVNPLLATLGDRLYFPAAFVGRGDMSRGGLLLRCVRAGRRLRYVPVLGSERRGPRPPKLSERTVSEFAL